MREFTKTEKKLLDGNIMRKQQRLMLVLGIVSACIGIFVLTYGSSRIIPKVVAPYEGLQKNIDLISVRTNDEIFLKQMLLESNKNVTTAWKELAENKTLQLFAIFMMMSGFMVGTAYNDRRYQKLIEKLRGSESEQDGS